MPSRLHTNGLFLDIESVDRGDLDLSELYQAVPNWTMYPHSSHAEAITRSLEADVVVTNKVPLTAAYFDACPRVRLVCVAATGVNHIDLNAARQHGVVVTNVRDYATSAVTQHVFALLLTLVTRMDAYRQDIADGKWQNSSYFCLLDHTIHELSGKRLTVVGMGVLGKSVSRVARAFGMEVVAARRPGPGTGTEDRRPTLESLLPRTDVLSLHCPLTPHSRQLVDAPLLRQLPDSAFLINTARGGLIDEPALADALRNGQLAGAGLDVLSTEPPPPDHPLLAADIPNLVVTPHTAWAGHAARQALINQIAGNIEAVGRSRPQNLVE